MMFPVKFRKRGTVMVVDVNPDHTPSDLLDTVEEGQGVDLTPYSVVHVVGGRLGRQKAERIAREMPRCVVVYEYGSRRGEGSGIVLPSGFDFSKVRPFDGVERAESMDRSKLEAMVRGVSSIGLRIEGDFVVADLPVRCDEWRMEIQGNMALRLETAYRRWLRSSEYIVNAYRLAQPEPSHHYLKGEIYAVHNVRTERYETRDIFGTSMEFNYWTLSREL